MLLRSHLLSVTLGKPVAESRILSKTGILDEEYTADNNAVIS